MRSNFSQFQIHRQYILSLYRYSLRNIKCNCKSIQLRDKVFEKLRVTIHKNKNVKKGFPVYELIQKLITLNDDLKEKNVVKIWNQLQPVCDKTTVVMKKTEEVVQLVNKLHPKIISKKSTQTTDEVQKAKYLFDYIKYQQSKNKLPKHGLVNSEYKLKLLLPMALDYTSKFKINLSKKKYKKIKTPPTYLVHKKIGSNFIWFVRSIINKHSNQSKKLSSIIQQEIIKAQERLDAIKRIEDMKDWAILESRWEKLLTGTADTDWILTYDIVLDKLKSENIRDRLRFKNYMNKRILNNGIHEAYSKNPNVDVSRNLMKENIQAQKNSKNHFNKSQFDYYHDLSVKYYNFKMKHFYDFLENEVPKNIVYVKDLNLYNLSVKNGIHK
ncbi:hypothetical protein TBLA_0F03650 [Henningerozyma blattae CBS 6284]|uniref:Required for respiratory growth protein 1, mitochondrial n=1 Tax=Henningerozyma blattae (strain ATCC 34711 / CBS 6284 / DSM 70876 / NBRC 10599 / NRRL Y-10934 / UCD 77-7) TaxID=1071380 RepID=I2H6A0_HENB6|nr:hypothetical protein TBLA_0F03650 [Tetrapisispora blattae CBS 6284]CCH61902.1 hypothetical protein TBLA_0F03650 [Tetrapisispora blattae CBS 6284]